MAVNYDVNYDDKRFTAVKNEEKAALTEAEKTFDGMIDNSDKFYDKQIQASKDYEKKQTAIQNQQTDLAIKEINQQKAQAQKDYTKEQSGAYTDWQKQSNQYGANAEARAANGMTNTGYSESSQVAMYNQYQQRVTTARESFVLAKQNYDNKIAEARLQNSSALAKIAYESLQQQLSLALEGFKYKNQLVLEKTQAKREIKNDYFTRWEAVLDQINEENALNEQARQHNKIIEIQEEQLAEEKRQFNETIALQRAQLAAKNEKAGTSKSGRNGSSNRKVNKVLENSSSTYKGEAYDKVKKAAKEVLGGKKESKQPTPDMKSVLSLGYGPISAGKLNSLIEKGIVQEYVDGDKLKYRKVFPR